MRKLAVYALAVCSLIGSSCATLLKGNKEEITVVSDPSGADVTSNENQEGPTPVTFTVPSKQDLNLTVSKTGYQPEDLQDPASFRWGWEAFSFFSYVIPMVVDLSDGAAWGHDHLTMTAHLEPNSQPTSAAAAAAAPSAASTASEVQASPMAVSTPAAGIESNAAAPGASPAAAPSASTVTQPADIAKPSVPE